ncbi:MAG: benzoylformate decarboxylase [Symbiobacteriia bacterium]
MAETVHSAVYKWMEARGLTYVFGNPGSTELGFLSDFPASCRYILSLQESVAVAMADGYAQGTGRPAFLNLHTAPGLGNGIAALFTAAKNKTPLIVTAGQQDTRMLRYDPLLSGPLTDIARSVCKWSHQPATAAAVPAALERAYHIAMTPPMGPVFIAIPMDFWEQHAVYVAPREVHRAGTPAPGQLAGLAQAINQAANPVLVAGAGIDRSGAWNEAIDLAEKLGTPVWAEPLAPRATFPNDHPLFKGHLKPAQGMIAQSLLGHDLVVVLGAPAFLYYPNVPGPFTPPGARLWVVTDDPEDAARVPEGDALVAGLKEAIAALTAAVAGRGKPLPSRAVEVAKRRSAAARAKEKMQAAFVFHTLSAHVTPDTVVVDESISNSITLREFLPARTPGSYFTAYSGGLGWSMPAAVGLSLANPQRHVVVVVGDGSSMYAIQALWTAAQVKANVTFVVINNGHYGILKGYAQSFYPGQEKKVPGLDLPGIDIPAAAQALGVPAVRVDAPDDLAGVLNETFAAQEAAKAAAPDGMGGPRLVEVMIDPTAMPLV